MKAVKVRLFVGLVSLNRTCKKWSRCSEMKNPGWQEVTMTRDYILSSPAIARVKGILFVFDCWTTNNWIDLLENWWETLGKSPSKMICYELFWSVQSIPPYLSLGPLPLTTKRRTAKFASDREQLGDPGAATESKWSILQIGRCQILKLTQVPPKWDGSDSKNQTHHLTPLAQWFLIHCHTVKPTSIDPDS